MRKTFKRNGGDVFHGNLYRGCNLRINNYEQAKARYESVKPIGGARGKLGGDFRPVTDRYRTWECFLRDGDKYGIGFHSSYITYNHVKDDSGKSKSVPKSINGDPQPLLMFSPDNSIEYTSQWSSSYTTWDLLSAVLPEGMKFAKFGSKQYMELAQPDGSFQYFILPDCTGVTVRFVPYESEGKRFYRMRDSDIVQEYKYLIDRDKSKQMTEEFKSFVDYYRVMGDLLTCGVEADANWQWRHNAERFLNEGDWLIRKEGEEYGSKWADAVVAFFKINTDIRTRWVTGAAKLEDIVELGTVEQVESFSRTRLIKMIRPYRKAPVPVGVGFRPDGRSL